MSERPADPHPVPRPRAGRMIGIWLPAVAGFLVLAGAVLLAIPESPATFGWYAYVPLSTTYFVPGSWFSSPRHYLGAVLLIVGIGALLFCLGWRAGRRSRSRVARRTRNR